MKTKVFFRFLISLLPMLFFAGCTQGENEALAELKEVPNDDTSLQENVSRMQALEVANKFLGRDTLRTRSGEDLATIKEIKDGSETLVYVINYREGGFALVSGKTTYYPVLAFSDTGSFTQSENMHPELKKWLHNCESVISGKYELGDDTKRVFQSQWASYFENSTQSNVQSLTRATYSVAQQNSFLQRKKELGALGYEAIPLSQANNLAVSYGLNIDEYEQIAEQSHSPLQYTVFAFKESFSNSEVGPLLTTKWNQHYPYNGLSKVYDYPTGCVTIAMAQIMKYYEHPDTYNWANMPNDDATQDTQVLIRDLCNALGISYDSEESGSTINKAKKAFTSDAFQYDAIIKEHNLAEVKESLNKNNPVFMKGTDSESGAHAWVCDGYEHNCYQMKYFVEYLLGSEGNYYYDKGPYGYPSIDAPLSADKEYKYLHMNWGWGGSNNGWFVEYSAKVGDYDFGSERENIYVSPK